MELLTSITVLLHSRTSFWFHFADCLLIVSIWRDVIFMVSFGFVYVASFSFSGIFKMIDLKLSIWTSSETISVIFSLSAVYGHAFWCLYMPYNFFWLKTECFEYCIVATFKRREKASPPSQALFFFFKKIFSPCYSWYLWLHSLFSAFYEPIVWSLNSLSYNVLDVFG